MLLAAVLWGPALMLGDNSFSSRQVLDMAAGSEKQYELKKGVFFFFIELALCTVACWNRNVTITDWWIALLSKISLHAAELGFHGSLQRSTAVKLHKTNTQKKNNTNCFRNATGMSVLNVKAKTCTCASISFRALWNQHVTYKGPFRPSTLIVLNKWGTPT